MWYQVGVALFGALAIACSFLATYESRREQKAKDSQTPQWATSATMDLKRLEGQLGNRDATEEYLTLQRKLTQQYSGAMASVAVERFMGAKADRAKLRSSVEQANERALNAARMRIQPVKDLFLGMIDGWISELQKRDIRITHTDHDRDCAVTGAALRGNEVVRQISLPTGAAIKVYMLPGLVDDGHFLNPFQIAIQYEPKEGTDGYQCDISISETTYNLENDKPHRYTFGPYSSRSKDTPSDDAEFLKHVRTAIDQVMDHLIGLNVD